MEINSKITDNKLKISSNQAIAFNANFDKSALSNNLNLPVSYPVNQAIKANALSNNINKYTYLGEVSMPYLNEPAKLYQLDNGQKVVIVPKKGPTVIRTFVKVGSMNEPDNIRGISHYIEHNLFNGSSELAPGQFVDQVSKMGGKYNASTGFLTTDYFIQSPLHTPEDLPEFIKMHADMVQHPLYKEEQLVKEKGPVTSEIEMMGDNPNNTAVNTTLKNLFQIKTKSQDIVGGTVENIEGLTRDKVIDYYKNWYNPDNMTTVIVGEVDADSAAGLINRYFGQNAPSKTNKSYSEPLKPIQNTVRNDILNPNVESALLNMAFAGPNNDNLREVMATNALCGALTGYQNARLNKALRPFNALPSVGMESISPNLKDPSAILLDANFKQGTEEEGLKTIYTTLHEMTYKPVEEAEMVIIKNKLKESLKATSESAMGISSIIGHSMLDNGNIRLYSNSVQLIDSLTPYDIMQAAQKFLDLNKTAITMLHPSSGSVSNNAPNAKAVSFCGGKKLDTGDVSEHVLPNNLSVYANNVKNAPVVSAQIDLKTQNPFPIKPGIDLILSRMLSYGTAINSEETLENLKDTNNISGHVGVCPDGISIRAYFSKETAGLAYNIMKENLLHPNFNQENFERAKNELKLMYLSTQKSASSRALEELYPDHPIGNTVRKAIENIDNITLNDAVSAYSALLSNSSAKASVTGDFSSNNELLNQTNSSLGQGLPMFSPTNAKPQNSQFMLNSNKVIVEFEPKNQADVVQMFRIDETGNIKDKAAILLLNEILGGNSQSRLFSDLRETQKLAYRVKSSYTESDNKGALELKILTTTENSLNPNQSQNLKKSLEGFKKHINKLITEPVSLSEIEAAKLKIKSDLMFTAESVGGKNALLASGLETPYGKKYTDELFTALDAAKPEDIQKIAAHYLTKPSVISVIAGQNTIQANKNYLNSLEH